MFCMYNVHVIFYQDYLQNINNFLFKNAKKTIYSIRVLKTHFYMKSISLCHQSSFYLHHLFPCQLGQNYSIDMKSTRN